MDIAYSFTNDSFVACGTEAGQQQADSHLHTGNGTDLSQEETEEKKEGSEFITRNLLVE